MRLVTFLALPASFNGLLPADDFFPEGSDAVFTVTPEILLETPQWNPLAEPVPVSAAEAIRIAVERRELVFKNVPMRPSRELGRSPD